MSYNRKKKQQEASAGLGDGTFMNVSLHYILENPLFEHAQLLAGADGCFRTVERVSVFDSPFGMDVIEQGIIAPGDFFVTGLLQFSADSDALFEVFRVLIAGRAAASASLHSSLYSLTTVSVHCAIKTTFQLFICPMTSLMHRSWTPSTAISRLKI